MENNVNSGGSPQVVHLKAVYAAGEMLNKSLNGSDNHYTMSGDISYDVISPESAQSTIYGIGCQYRRINSRGYGVSRVQAPKLRVDLTPEGCTGTITKAVDIENRDIIDVLLTPTYLVDKIAVCMRNVYNSSIFSGGNLSAETEFKKADNFGGFVFKATWKVLTEQLRKLGEGLISNITMSFYGFQHIDLRRQATPVTNNGFTNQTHVSQKAAYFRNFMARAKAALGADAADKITYYQLQHALCTNQYLGAAEAEEYCKTNYSWCKEEMEETE